MRAASGVGELDVIWLSTPIKGERFNGTRVGVGGRVAVGDGVIVSVRVVVKGDSITLGFCVPPLVEMNGSYVGKVTGVTAAGAQEINKAERRKSEVILEKDIKNILPKAVSCKTFYEDREVIPL